MSARAKRERILVVDDDELVRNPLRQRLEEDGLAVVEAATGAEAVTKLGAGIDLVLLDCRLPDVEGHALLEQVHEIDPDLPVVMLTAHPTIELAVKAMKLGAHHYLQKPFEPDELALLVERALEVVRMRRKIRAMRGNGNNLESLIGESPKMKECKELLGRIAGSPSSTVLLTGESGTGKDLAAKAIHQGSDRALGPFVNITCTALSPTLLESELFGHERGAFTDAKTRKKGLVAHAQGGTVFLDEIGEMEPGVQAKLLRLIEDKTFRPVGSSLDVQTDVRIIAATNVDLGEAVRRHFFREDLFYRLAVLTVHLPPLRERPGDVELLIEAYVKEFAARFRKPIQRVARGVLRRLSCYPWPGNVRELRNAVERAVLLANGPLLTERDFAMILDNNKTGPGPAVVLPPGGLNLRDLERDLVVQALRRSRGNRTIAGSLLGLNRDQVRYRIERHKIAATEFDLEQ